VGWRLVQVGAVCAARSLNGPGSFSAPALGPLVLPPVGFALSGPILASKAFAAGGTLERG
jgi:hypothetical protein